MSAVLTGEYVGTAVEETMTFRNASGGLADPTTVIYTRQGPSDSAPTTETYDDGDLSGTITRLSLGVYQATWTGLESGEWMTQWEGTGAVQKVLVGTVIYKPAAFSP